MRRVGSPVDVGQIDWSAQFRELRDVGYSDAVNLETHWKGTGTMEKVSRISWAGMKKELTEGNG
jgi:sugar phosphate isomerase/epimerase